MKETWYLGPGETLELKLKFTDHIGKYVFHCHMIEHEDDGMMAQFEVVAPTPTPGQITLRAHGRRVQGRHTVDLTWFPVTSANIDIYRDGVRITTVPNTGSYKDFIGVRGGNARYTYKVCEAGTSNCSNEATVRFGGPPL
jgi:hypothetical protein